jgi:hypothetical protein
VVTSVNRLVAACPHSAAHVEALDPDITMRRLATSERTMTPAMASIRSHSSRARPVSTTPTKRGQRYRIAGGWRQEDA